MIGRARVEIEITLGRLKNLCWGGDDPEFELHKESEWNADEKYQARQVIFQHKETLKFYEFMESRSGSHWQGYNYWYEYEDEEKVLKIGEVRPVEKVIRAWETVYQE